MARARRSPAASVTAAGRSEAGARERVEALLAGESLDTSRLSYDFEATQIALVVAGPGAELVARRVTEAGRRSLAVEAAGGLVWAWLAGDADMAAGELERLVADPPPATTVALGEPAPGLAGWRLSHHQARAALNVGIRGDKPSVRYRDVALLATALKDELLSTSLRQIYLEPLESERNRGDELMRTLRAYLESNRNASVAGAAVGVTRQAVARRVRAAEEALGRPISECGPELELALRLGTLGAVPTQPLAPAP